MCAVANIDIASVRWQLVQTTFWDLSDICVLIYGSLLPHAGSFSLVFVFFCVPFKWNAVKYARAHGRETSPRQGGVLGPRPA